MRYLQIIRFRIEIHLTYSLELIELVEMGHIVKYQDYGVKFYQV